MSVMKRIPLAWRTVTHDKLRTLTASGGVCFVIMFTYLQLGFRGATENTATSMLRILDFDLALVSTGFVHMNITGALPKDRLIQAESDPDVLATTPLYVTFLTSWRGPAQPMEANIVLLGIPPSATDVIRSPGLAPQDIEALSEASTVLVDRESQSKLGPLTAGIEPTIGGRTVRIVGHFEMRCGFIADGTVIAGEHTFSDLTGSSSSDVNMGLVRLRPGADPRAAAERLEKFLPPDTRVLTRSELREIQLHRWLDQTAAGRIFTVGVLVAFIVGLVVLYQVLSTDIVNQLPEYATMKAMGYSLRQLRRVVLEASVFYALLGLVPAFFMALGLYALMRNRLHMATYMTAERAVGVVLLTLLMCAGSGLVAMRKLALADPADCF